MASNIFLAGTGLARPYTPFVPPDSWKVSPAPVVAPTPPISVGLEPTAYEAVLYGKEKPLYVGGSLLIGGRIIEGPFYGVDANGDPTVSAIYYFAENGNPTGSHDITEFRIRGAVAGVDGSGYLTDPQFTASAVAGREPRVQYRTGTRTQMPFNVSIARYGANAIAYRQGIVVSLEHFPLRATNGIIPFLGVYIEDSSFGDPGDPVSRKDLLETLLRYARLKDADIEVDVPGTWHFLIVPSKSSLLEFLQNLRSLYVHWNITYTDKMRIIDPTNFSVAVEIAPNNHVLGSMSFAKSDPLIVPRRKNLKYIDIDRDNEPNVVSAQEDIYPAPSTSSVDEQNIELSVGMTASEATADVNVSLYEELAARSQMQAVLQPLLFAAEPGDACRVTDNRVHAISWVGRAIETAHDLSKFTVDVTAGEVLNCGADVSCDPVPDGALAFIDFICPQYWVEDVEYEQDDVIGGTGTAEVVESEGLLVDGLNGSWPNASGVLFDLLETLILGDGFTIVYEFKTIDDGVTGYLMYAYNAANTHSVDLSYALNANPTLNFTRGSTTGSVSPAVISGPFAAGVAQRVAYSFVPDPTRDDGGHQAISVDGQVVDQRESDEFLDNLFAFNIGHALNGNPAGYIRKIIVYALKDDADLPGLSEAP